MAADWSCAGNRGRPGGRRVWELRPATEADDWLLRQHAPGLRSAFGVLRVLTLDGAPVGFFGVEDRHGTRAAARGAMAFRMVVFVAPESDPVDAAEAADRLLDALARSVDVPLSVAELRTACAEDRRADHRTSTTRSPT